MFFSRSFIVSGLRFKSSIHTELIIVCSVIGVPFHSSACDYTVFPTQFIEGTIFSPLSILGFFVKYQLTIYVGVYIWALYLVSLFYVFIFSANTIQHYAASYKFWYDFLQWFALIAFSSYILCVLQVLFCDYHET